MPGGVTSLNMRLLLCLLAVATTWAAAAAETKKAEILWDRFGVPHIFAPDRESMFHAHGWSQMHNHADLLLKLYGQSRGRASEYWGHENLESDRWVHLNDIPKRAQSWYQAQDPTFRKYLDAFARGINDYAAKHPEHASPAARLVLPVTGVDVVQHTMRAVHFAYMGSRNRLATEAGPRGSGLSTGGDGEPDEAIPGSNTWAVGPPRSASGKSMLIINPHLQWGDFYTYMEVHLTAPDYDLYGAPQIGFPVPVIGFNPRTGWGRTVNTIDTVDFYELTVRDGGYEYDGQIKKFEQETKTIKVKGQPDVTFTARRSIHGPVVYERDGRTLAMRVAGIGVDRPKMLEQWFRMGGARNLKEFQDALRMGQIPMWHANYADADGHIMLVFNGLVARRPQGDYQYWSRPVPGNTSKTLWTDYLTFDELPKVIDPPSGFTQNANEPPWQFTSPNLDPAKYPAYVAPGNERLSSFRTRRSFRMLYEDPKITYDELLAYKHSTRVELADAVMDDLLKAAGPNSEAAKVLAKWDRMMETTSRGAVLFILWVDRYFAPGIDFDASFRVRYDRRDLLHTPAGLSDPARASAALEQAAATMRERQLALDVPYGEVYRYARGKADLPGNGGSGRLGLFRTMTFGQQRAGRFYPTHGETFVCAIEFGAPQQARCLLGYGNASQPGSPHIEDQLPFMTRKELHPVWRSRKEIEANLERKETLN